MVVYLTYNPPEAYIVAGRLQSEGINAWVHQPVGANAIGITIGPLGEVRVLVDAPDYDRALAILNEDAPAELSDDVDRFIYGINDSDEDDPDDE
jgi:hypothetical protein